MAFKVSTLLTTGVISFLYIFLSLYVEFYLGIYVCLFFVLTHLALLFSFKKGITSENMITHLFGVMTIIGLGFCSFYTGGYESPVLLWFVATLVVSFWFSDMKTSRLWIGITLLIMSFFFLGYSVGFHFPVKLNMDLFGLFKFSMSVGIVIFLMVVFKTFEAWRSSAIKELDDLNCMKDRMMSMVAHDLKNPLMVMMGHIGLAKSGKPLTERTLSLFEGLNTRMKQIIDNMLIFERLQKGKFRFEFKHVDVNELLENLLLEFNGQARQKNIHLHFHRGEVLVISTDQLAMERILTNLISNALKYTPSEKNVVIKVVGSQIIIQDEGVGLSDEFKKSLFNIYAQGGGKIIHFKDESNGIGLYIVKELCDQLNFEITAASPGINQGATFTLNLAPHRG